MEWNIKFTKTSTRIVLLIVQFVAFFSCLLYISHVYTVSIYPDQYARNHFEMTSCAVLDKRMAIRQEWIGAVYRALFLVSYKVGGVQYNRWVSGNGMDMTPTKAVDEEQALLGQYHVGEQYICHYNPMDPAIGVLVIRDDWRDTFPLMIPAVVALLVLYYLFLNAYSLIISALILREE